MRPATSKPGWFAAAVCVLATSGLAIAEEAVVRISDGGPQTTAPAEKPAQAVVPPNGAAYYQSQAYSPQAHFNAYAKFYGLNEAAPVKQTSARFLGSHRMQNALAESLGQPATQQVAYKMQGCSDGCNPNLPCGDTGCTSGGWGQSGCGCGPEGCTQQGACCGSCNQNACGCNSGYACDPCGNGWGNCDSCDACGRCRLFARGLPKDCCNTGRCRWWRGQQLNYAARNKRLSNCLFGWMIPSGCCGQGCPPVGCYDITYADNPSYADPRDGQVYGAQGYGTHMTVPLAPTVNYQYNYSWGTPASRLTPIGQYDPQTSLQPLYGRSF